METGRRQEYKTLKDFGQILSFFNRFDLEESGVAEISRAVGMSPSKVSRMLGTLQGQGFFEKNPETGKYRIGIAFFEIGMVYAFNLPLRKIVRPHIEQMAKDLNLTASWAILRSSKVIVMDRVQNLNIDMLTHRIGLNLPVHSTSLGKVLLAYLPEEEQNGILKSANLTQFTSNTITDPNLLKMNLRLIRDRGYSTDEEETHEDLNCMAVPIRNGTEQVIAGINLMDEKSRTSAQKLFQFAPYLKERSLFISRQLGYGSNR